MFQKLNSFSDGRLTSDDVPSRILAHLTASNDGDVALRICVPKQLPEALVVDRAVDNEAVARRSTHG